LSGEGHPAHKNPVVVPVSFSFVRALVYPGYPGLKGCKTVVCSEDDSLPLAALMSVIII